MTIRSSILIATFITATSGSALAQDWAGQRHGPHDSMHEERGEGPNIDMIANRLGLDPETKDKLKAIKRQARHDLMDARFAVKKEKLGLRELLEEETPSESQIMRQIEEIGRLEVEVHKLKIRSLLAARELLTPEQRVTMKKIRRAQKEKRRGERKHRKMKRQF